MEFDQTESSLKALERQAERASGDRGKEQKETMKGAKETPSCRPAQGSGHSMLQTNAGL